MERANETEIYILDHELEADRGTYGERLLLSALIMNAVFDLKKSGLTARKAREFFLNPDEDYVFSFRSICAYLNIDPSLILGELHLR